VLVNYADLQKKIKIKTRAQNQLITVHQNLHSFSLEANPKMSLDQLTVILDVALVK